VKRLHSRSVQNPTKHATTTALGALGALVVHQLAYLVVAPAGPTRVAALAVHRHLPLEWSVVTPLAVLAAVAFILRQVRLLAAAGVVPDQISARQLTFTAAALFAVQEVIEAGLFRHNLSVLWTNPALGLGLALCPVVAVAVARFLRGTTELIARLWHRPRPAAIPRSRFVPMPLTVPSSPSRRAGCRPRGPPRRSFH
jgi:hypothetical protein